MNTTYTDQIYEPGTLPPLGCIPRRMHAWTIRQDRLGDPLTAFRDEIVELPALKPHEVLVANVSVGINYNGIWAARGAPKNAPTEMTDSPSTSAARKRPASYMLQGKPCPMSGWEIR